MKKTGIRKKPKSEEQKEMDRLTREADMMFYMKIWTRREHVCASCDTYIYGEMKPLYMDHICEKSVWEHLRYEPDNIAILCGDCHHAKGSGFVNEKYRKLIDKTKKKFGI